ncbi:MAG: phosphatidate cytidylyltransferase [Thermoanaerobaculia bacterium]|nr:phosphatidate cytidylyltransferase [Thermoanaerobaculia bacterium]
MTRVVTGVVAGAIAVAAVLLLDSPAIFWVCLVLFVGVALELAALGRRLAPALASWCFVAVLPLVTALWRLHPDDPTVALAALAAAPLVYAVVSLSGGGDLPGAVTGLGLWSFATVYLALPVWSLYEIHRLDPRLLLVLLISVWCNDSAAYLVGSRIGRRKLAPRLSPNKTVEGSIAGLVAAGAVGWAGAWWIGADEPMILGGCVLGTGVAAQLGDLVESLLKRAAGVKDSGRILPGHGGLLDRLDAIILAAPVFYAVFGLTGAATSV